MKNILSTLLALPLTLSIATAFASPGSGPYNLDSLLRIRKSRVDGKISIIDIKTPADEIQKLIYIPVEHPSSDSVPVDIYARIATRKQLLAKDSLSSAELFWVMRPFLLWLQNIDPHLRVQAQPIFTSHSKKARSQAANLPLPGFVALNIHDSLIVERSADSLFQRGDQILAINDVPVSQYLQYGYDDRHVYSFTLLSNYHYELVRAADYNIRLIRDGRVQEIKTAGMPWSKVYLNLIRQQEFETRTYKQAKAGYFKISEFYPNNKLLIAKLRKAILDARKKGCNSFILDLRGNTGGHGSAFDKLLSIFIDKPSIPYLKSRKLKVSKRTLQDLDFLTKEMVGQVVEVPEKQTVKEISLDRDSYISGMKYYVLMDKDTGSIAATFCNILQYNDAARLVGEPLMHNALKYGEVLGPRWIYLTSLIWSSLSCTEFDEYTQAVDGVLVPDIAIPYVAANFLSGSDAVLDELVKRIESDTVD